MDGCIFCGSGEGEAEADKLVPVSHRRGEFARRSCLKSYFLAECKLCAETPLRLGGNCLGITVDRGGAQSSDPAVVVDLDVAAATCQLCYVDDEWRHRLQYDSAWRPLLGKGDAYLAKCGMPLEIAQYYVGVMHALGIHVAVRDVGAARALWERAAARGHRQAWKSLQPMPLASVRAQCAFHAPPMTHPGQAALAPGQAPPLPQRPPAWWRILPSAAEDLPGASKQRPSEGLAPKKRARGVLFNDAIPQEEIIDSESGNAVSSAAAAPDAVSRAHAAVEAMVGGFAVAMRTLATDTASSGRGDGAGSGGSGGGGGKSGQSGKGAASTPTGVGIDALLGPVLQHLSNFDDAVDSLPGLDRTTEQQLEVLAALEKELKAQQNELSDAIREAKVQQEVDTSAGRQVLAALNASR